MVDVDYNGDGTAEVVRVTDVNAEGVVPDDAEDQEVTWTSDKTYELNGLVFVNKDETLTIEPGTEIQGRTGGGENASALIVARGGKIVADGEKSDGTIAPIVFTSVRAAGEDLSKTDRGLWGGVILLGDAGVNTTGGTNQIEGVPEDQLNRNDYGGGMNPANSHDIGTFRYVSIRHTGSTLAAGSEIQGLTLGAIGSGSTIEYVESYASNDDGFEWFGGTVNTKYLIAAYAADDAFDLDEGYRGSNQFWLAVQAGDAAGRIGEHDGGTEPEDGKPFATTVVSNATYIGMGPGLEDGAVSGDANDPFLIQRDNNATSYHNTIFTGGRTNAGLQIEDLAGNDEDAANRWDGDGDGTPSTSDPLKHKNNIWHNIGPDFDANGSFDQLIQLTEEDFDGDGNLENGDRGTSMKSNLATYLDNNGNELASNSPLTDINRQDGDGAIVDFNPAPLNAATSMTAQEPSAFGDTGGVNATWTNVSFIGAFGSGASWNLSDNWAVITEDIQ